MLLAHYRHRLPADDGLDRVRARVAARGPSWDDAPGLVFKAFLVEDRARGARESAYASLYLWRETAAAADFLAGPGFAAVADAFGRPRTRTWLALDARRGPARGAASLAFSERLVGPGEDVASLRAAEREAGRAVAGRADVLATVAALDPDGWRLVRATLRAGPPEGPDEAEVAHLAAPGLDALALDALAA